MSVLLLKGGRVADGERRTLETLDVLVRDGVIEKVGSNLVSADAEVVDCTGFVVTAGYIDAHVHVESGMVLPEAFGEAVLCQGTTAIIADPHEVVNVAGGEGLRLFMKMCDRSPADIFVSVPSCVPATPLDTNGAGKFLAADMEEFVDDPRVVGLGEVMSFYDAAEGKPEIADKIALFKRHDKTIDGHTSGMPEGLLDAYVAAGVENDHECDSEAGMCARYEKGMNIYIREGSAARNASEILDGIKRRGLDISRFAFCTDDKHLATIAKEGHISYIVAMALEKGFSWGEAAAMASYNASRFYRLNDRGNVRAGLRADLVVASPDARRTHLVLKDGEIAAVDQKSVIKYTECDDEPLVFENTVEMRKFSAKDFVVPDRLKNVAIGLVDGQLLTEKAEVAESERPNLLATAERYGRNGNLAVCFLKGYGIEDGAVATSVSHDSHNAVCAGSDGENMAVALNRLSETGGGYVIAKGGKVIAELPMPAFGLMAVGGAEETARKIDDMENIAHSMGVNRGVDAFTTLSFVALPVIPRLRLLDTGLYDTGEEKFL